MRPTLGSKILHNYLPAIEISAVSVRNVARGTTGAAITVRIVRGPGYRHYEAGILHCPNYHSEWKCRCCYWRSKSLSRKNRNPPGVQQLRICSWTENRESD